MYENYETMAKELDEILNGYSSVSEDGQEYDKDKVLESIKVSNENLDKEFELIDKIKIESLKAALSEELFL
jgi:hypothetical protein